MWKQITFFLEHEHLPFPETAKNKLAIDGGYRGGRATNQWPAGRAATLLGPHALMESFFLFFSFLNLVLAATTPSPTAPTARSSLVLSYQADQREDDRGRSCFTLAAWFGCAL